MLLVTCNAPWTRVAPQDMNPNALNKQCRDRGTHCEPLVFGPAFAMLKIPGLACVTAASHSVRHML